MTRKSHHSRRLFIPPVFMLGCQYVKHGPSHAAACSVAIAHRTQHQMSKRLADLRDTPQSFRRQPARGRDFSSDEGLAECDAVTQRCTYRDRSSAFAGSHQGHTRGGVVSTLFRQQRPPCLTSPRQTFLSGRQKRPLTHRYCRSSTRIGRQYICQSGPAGSASDAFG